MQVKDGCTKILYGTLEAFPHAIAGIHTFIYSGSHVLAVGVIPLLASCMTTHMYDMNVVGKLAKNK